MKSEILSSLVCKEDSSLDYLYLTFDFDWASEEVLSFLFRFLELRNLKATFFVTHDSKVASQYYENPNFEFGIHPNFNFLTQGDFRYGSDISQILDYYESFLPYKPKGMRSHDSFFKTSLIRELSNRNYLYESNILLNQDFELKPFNNWGGNIQQLPMLWEDDQWCISSIKNAPIDILLYKHMKIVNFHPIHVYLNSYNLDAYNQIKSSQSDMNIVNLAINENKFGVFDFLKELVDGM